MKQCIWNGHRVRGYVLAVAFMMVAAIPAFAADPLPSWNEGPVKSGILRFVDAVTRPDSPEFVPQAERVAVFDNDGTLWTEWPRYLGDRFMSDQHSSYVGRLFSSTTAEELNAQIKTWLAQARHEIVGRPFTDLAYVPMRELLDLLRAKGFTPYIVSGGLADIVRVYAEKLYGVPPENVIGSTLCTEYEDGDHAPALELRLWSPACLKPTHSGPFRNEGAGKPVGIWNRLGRKPIAAFGNSDGDLEMLQWTMAAPGARLALIVRHDDCVREFCYTTPSPVGQLDKALAAALADPMPPDGTRGWLVVAMKTDWNRVWSFPWTAPAR